MFAGIIERTGVVVRLADHGDGARLDLELGAWLDELRIGASVAVNGACLTLADAREGVGSFDLVAETLRRTALGRLRAGDAVNLERSLRAGERIDGHFVQGHVDGVGAVIENGASRGEWSLVVGVPQALEPFLVPKGSVAIDGVSLTIAGVETGRLRVALIPTTLERTTLGARRVGDAVNLETDILARVIVWRVDELLGSAARAVGRADAGDGGGLAERAAGVGLSALRDAGRAS